MSRGKKGDGTTTKTITTPVVCVIHPTIRFSVSQKDGDFDAKLDHMMKMTGPPGKEESNLPSFAVASSWLRAIADGLDKIQPDCTYQLTTTFNPKDESGTEDA